MGSALLEKHYQRSLAVQFKHADLGFSEQVPVKLLFSSAVVGKYFLDFIVEDLVIVEIKAARILPSSSFKQTLAYLREKNLPLGIVANFRSISLRPVRVLNPSFKDCDLMEIDQRYITPPVKIDQFDNIRMNSELIRKNSGINYV